MKSKVLLTAISLLVTASLLLTGCGGSSNQNVQNLDFWYALPGESGGVVQKLVQKFNESHKDIHINATFVPTGERLQKLTAALGAGNPPDLYTAGPPDLGQLQGTAQIASVDQLTKGKLNGNLFFPAPRSIAEVDGKLWALPASAGVIGLYYNKDLFEKAGIKAPPKTWDEFIQDAIKLTDPSKGQTGIVLPTAPELYTTTVWQSYLWQNGGDILTTNPKKAAFNSPEGVEALQLWVDLIYKYKVAALANLNENTAMQTFGAGQAGMIPAMPAFVESSSKFPFKTATAIMPKGKVEATSLGGWYVVIPNKSKHQQAAADFLTWLNQPENISQWNIGTGSIPTSSQVSGSNLYQEYVQKTPLAKVFVDEMDIAKAPPAIAEYASISKLIAVAINNAIFQKQTPKEALDEAAQKVNKLLENK